MLLEVNSKNFTAEVLQAGEPVLLDFYADWCMPCKMLAPVMEEISREAPGVKVAKINIDREPQLARQFQVMSIPTLVVLKEGKVAGTAVGLRPKQEIMEMLAM